MSERRSDGGRRTRRADRLRARHRPGDPRPAGDRARRCSAAASCPSASRRTRAPAPSASGLPGSLPVANARAIHFGLMIGLALGSRARAALDLPPQELLLSRPAQGLPDLPVRRAAVPRRPARRGAHPSRAPRGGRRQARPRRRERAHPRLRREHRRLQPRRHAAGGDRHRARPALGRAGGRVAEAAAHDAAPARRQRREHGGGLAALRRQHLAAPRGQRASSAPRPS